MGTAYADRSGIGAVGILLLGIFLLSEAATLARFLFVAMTAVGVVGLKLASAH